MDLRFGIVDMTNINKRESGKKETIRKVLTHFKYSKYIEKKKSTYAWGMHEHVTYKRKFIMGSAQSNPTSTQ